MAGNGLDPVAAAIAAVPAERRVELRIGLPTGRIVALNMPVDLSDDEFLHLVAEIATGTRRHVRGQPNQARLLIPR